MSPEYQLWNDKNKLQHLFGKKKHLFDDLIAKMYPGFKKSDAEKLLGRDIMRKLYDPEKYKEVIKKLDVKRLFKKVEIVVGGEKIIVSGKIQPDGLIRIGTCYRPR